MRGSIKKAQAIGIIAALILITGSPASAADLTIKKPAPTLKKSAGTAKAPAQTAKKPVQTAKAPVQTAKKTAPKPKKPAQTLAGLASVYSEKGTRSASGEIINPKSLVAAHRSLGFGTRVKVTNRRNGRTVVVRIIDRGPFVRGRIIDLSPAAARVLGISGLAPVSLSVLETDKTS
ncbi:MAG TPA: septal ring lytic transglycosylase RlpA family protein [Xanthobacteraceae bacterium]|nr:septal ring lytic transglycosylase RlpA family protein [Xanthobacteraceae bacterium]